MISPLNLEGNRLSVRLTNVLALELRDDNGKLLFASSRTDVPAVTLADRTRVALHTAAEVTLSRYEDNGFIGHRLGLTGLGESDAQLELVLALDDDDALLIAVEQTGGTDVRQVEHLYRFEKPVAARGCMVLPHGSGYLVDADCPDELPGTDPDQSNMVGGRWSLPLFGMVCRDAGMCIIVEDWWDCRITAVHEPGIASALDIDWVPSLGKLAYRRQLKVHVGQGMDHTAMAKLYREQYARPQGLVRTLAEKAEITPMIKRYIEGIVVRSPGWNPDLLDTVLADLKRFREMGFAVTLFFPKWPSRGFPETTMAEMTDGGWMAWMHPSPVPGGWPALKRYLEQVRELGCSAQAFMNPGCHLRSEPTFDEQRLARDEDGNLPRCVGKLDYNYFCSFDEVERICGAFDYVAGQGITFDALYFDGYAAYCGVLEDFTPEHPVTRRQNFDAESQVMAYARRRGTMAGGELARFWCLHDCDFFFYTDWSQDRLCNVPTRDSSGCVGDWVPLFQLVFHDCYMAGFAGGGHYTVKNVDWWHDSTPRLYELMSCSAPCFNWMPQCRVPVSDWTSDIAQARLDWLKLRSAFFRATAMSEMTSHTFLSDDRKQHRIEFANGVTAEFDIVRNRCRVVGVEGFSGDWQEPCAYLGAYGSALEKES